MPSRLILITKVMYSDLVCWITYIVSAAVGVFTTGTLKEMENFLQNLSIQFASTLITLLSCSIIVFYVKKWLSRKDNEINKDGGLFSFVRKYLREKYNNSCKDKCE